MQKSYLLICPAWKTVSWLIRGWFCPLWQLPPSPVECVHICFSLSSYSDSTAPLFALFFVSRHPIHRRSHSPVNLDTTARIRTLKWMHHRFTCSSFFVPNVCSFVYTLSCCTYVWTSAICIAAFFCNKFACSATKHKRLIYYRCIADMVLSVYRRWEAERFVSAVSICAECQCSCACASENR